MKRIIAAVLLCVLLAASLSFGSSRRAGKKRKQVPDTAQTLDSLHWLIERHCDIRTEAMGAEDGTLALIVRKFHTLPPRVADSLLAAQYDYIVRLFEQERNARAKAWKKELKAWKKAHKGQSPKFEDYCAFRNDSVLTILRERAASSLENLQL